MINQHDQERLIRMAANAVASLAVEFILSTEPFKSQMPLIQLEAPPPKLNTKRKPPRKPKK